MSPLQKRKLKKAKKALLKGVEAAATALKSFVELYENGVPWKHDKIMFGVIHGHGLYQLALLPGTLSKEIEGKSVLEHLMEDAKFVEKFKQKLLKMEEKGPSKKRVYKALGNVAYDSDLKLAPSVSTPLELFHKILAHAVTKEFLTSNGVEGETEAATLSRVIEKADPLGLASAGTHKLEELLKLYRLRQEAEADPSKAQIFEEYTIYLLADPRISSEIVNKIGFATSIDISAFEKTEKKGMQRLEKEGTPEGEAEIAVGSVIDAVARLNSMGITSGTIKPVAKMLPTVARGLLDQPTRVEEINALVKVFDKKSKELRMLKEPESLEVGEEIIKIQQRLVDLGISVIGADELQKTLPGIVGHLLPILRESAKLREYAREKYGAYLGIEEAVEAAGGKKEADAFILNSEEYKISDRDSQRVLREKLADLGIAIVSLEGLAEVIEKGLKSPDTLKAINNKLAKERLAGQEGISSELFNMVLDFAKENGSLEVLSMMTIELSAAVKKQIEFFDRVQEVGIADKDLKNIAKAFASKRRIEKSLNIAKMMPVEDMQVLIKDLEQIKQLGITKFYKKNRKALAKDKNRKQRIDVARSIGISIEELREVFIDARIMGMDGSLSPQRSQLYKDYYSPEHIKRLRTASYFSNMSANELNILLKDLEQIKKLGITNFRRKNSRRLARGRWKRLEKLAKLSLTDLELAQVKTDIEIVRAVNANGISIDELEFMGAPVIVEGLQKAEKLGLDETALTLLAYSSGSIRTIKKKGITAESVVKATKVGGALLEGVSEGADDLKKIMSGIERLGERIETKDERRKGGDKLVKEEISGIIDHSVALAQKGQIKRAIEQAEELSELLTGNEAVMKSAEAQGVSKDGFKYLYTTLLGSYSAALAKPEELKKIKDATIALSDDLIPIKEKFLASKADLEKEAKSIYEFIDKLMDLAGGNDELITAIFKKGEERGELDRQLQSMIRANSSLEDVGISKEFIADLVPLTTKLLPLYLKQPEIFKEINQALLDLTTSDGIFEKRAALKKLLANVFIMGKQDPEIRNIYRKELSGFLKKHRLELGGILRDVLREFNIYLRKDDLVKVIDKLGERFSRGDLGELNSSLQSLLNGNIAAAHSVVSKLLGYKNAIVMIGHMSTVTAQDVKEDLIAQLKEVATTGKLSVEVDGMQLFDLGAALAKPGRDRVDEHVKTSVAKLTKHDVLDEGAGRLMLDRDFSNIGEVRSLEFKKHYVEVFNFSSTKFSGLKVEESTIYRSSFDNGSFEEAKIWGSTFEDSRFNKCKLSEINVSESEFINCSLRKAKFIDSTLIKVDFKRSDFAGANLNKTEFRNCKFEETSFKSAELEDVSFEGSEFTKVDFEGGKFTKTLNLKGVRMDEETANGLKSAIKQSLLNQSGSHYFSSTSLTVTDSKGKEVKLVVKKGRVFGLDKLTILLSKSPKKPDVIDKSMGMVSKRVAETWREGVYVGKNLGVRGR
jgi:uncharacterized protein YjbI with pentapeptide repeats